MKIRQGFVSNSSSSSFVITWKHRTIYDLSTAEALVKLLKIWCADDMFEDVRNNVFKEKTEDTQDKEVEVLKELIKHTKLENGIFETSCFTSMKNSYIDYSYYNFVQPLVLALLVSKEFEIVRCDELDDGGW
jgi:patatin-like phospholipase/acyl hydrolase